MGLTERYIQEVIRHVPKGQREEISMEIRELIDEMQMGEGMSEEQVLLKLGKPVEFANKYQDRKNHLIGPSYFSVYLSVLKIVLICVIAVSILADIISVVTRQAIVQDMGLSALTSPVWAFGIVTLIFAILERASVSLEVRKKEGWHPSQLPPLMSKAAKISKADSIVSIVVMAICGSIVCFVPELIGVYVFDNQELSHVIPFFNLDKWNMVLPFLIVVFILALIDEIIRLIVGRYGLVVMLSTIILSLVQLMLAFILLRVLPLWNMSFIEEMQKTFRWVLEKPFDIVLQNGMHGISNLFFVFIVVVTVIEIGVVIYKTMRYAGVANSV